MALTGSTRLQASSVLMAFVGACLREVATGQKAGWIISELIDRVTQMDPRVFIPLIEIESLAHLKNQFTLHRSRSAAMPVLTDTTERAPTFSLAPFESSSDHPTAATASRTYLEIPRAKSSLEAWHHLLRRDPRPFEVTNDVRAPSIDLAATIAFDFSDGVTARRNQYGVETTTVIDIEFGDYDGTTPDPSLFFRAANSETKFETNVSASRDPLVRQSQMKYALNLQSTLTMGRIGRFHGNLMTFVRPTNNKLIDRALRTLRILALESARAERDTRLENLALAQNDEPFLSAIFQALDNVTADQPVALKALEILRR
jgi:N-acetylmuramic acid 6-phosphate etherase